MTTKIKHRPQLLLILDGFGYQEDKQHNAIANAKTPYWDYLWENYPHCLIEGSGKFVGLPDDQMGNSEVGHLNLGAGRVVYQDFTRINHDIETGAFFKNPITCEQIDLSIKNQSAVHLIGLLSPGGVHSHIEHFLAMARLAHQRGVKKLYLHAFLDGRDTPPRSALASIQQIESLFSELKLGKIASICGRYYAMDRDNRWDRIEKAYNLLTEANTEFKTNNAIEALSNAYQRQENDEFVQPTWIGDSKEGIIKDNDLVIFMNFRADRARQLTQALTKKDFHHFKRQVLPKLQAFLCLTEYDTTYQLPVIFPPDNLYHILGEYLANLGLKQLRIAETEKYAHVTFFFNGGIETPFDGEDRLLIPSPKVETYDLKPEMSAFEITEKLVEAIQSQAYDFIVCNFANADMVGHTGNFEAAKKAIECLDTCLSKIIPVLQQTGGEALITADHGNADCMFDQNSNQEHTAHTKNPVPLLYIGRPGALQEQGGVLADIAPTILSLMDLPIPDEMTGKVLLRLNTHEKA